MNIARLRLLTFDVTDTLLKFRSAPGKKYGEIGSMYGVLCDSNDLTANFKTHWRKMNQEHPNFGLESGLGWEMWWKQIITGTFKDTNCNLDKAKLDAIASDLIDAYKTFTCWQHCSGALDLLSYLKHKGIPLGVVSNFDPRLDVTLENAKLRHYFKFVITSYEVGVEKPNPQIFEEAMKVSEIADLKPEECLHVGDTPSLDYEGARRAGWHAALVHNNKLELENGECVELDHVFPSLFELHKHFIDGNGEKQILQSKN